MGEIGQKFKILDKKIGSNVKKIITFEWMDGFSNLKKVKHSEFRQEFNENIICHLDPDPDPKNGSGSGSGSSKKGPNLRIRIRIRIRIHNTGFKKTQSRLQNKFWSVIQSRLKKYKIKIGRAHV